MKKVAVYKIVIGDGTLANLDERLLDGLYTDSSISKEIERIRAINGKENKLTQDKKAHQCITINSDLSFWRREQMDKKRLLSS